MAGRVRGATVHNPEQKMEAYGPCPSWADGQQWQEWPHRGIRQWPHTPASCLKCATSYIIEEQTAKRG